MAKARRGGVQAACSPPRDCVAPWVMWSSGFLSLYLQPCCCPSHTAPCSPHSCIFLPRGHIWSGNPSPVPRLCQPHPPLLVSSLTHPSQPARCSSHHHHCLLGCELVVNCALLSLTVPCSSPLGSPGPGGFPLSFPEPCLGHIPGLFAHFPHCWHRSLSPAPAHRPSCQLHRGDWGKV